jgi:predicted nucleotidyltransferase
LKSDYHTILRGIGGSHAHGLATDASDEDRIGVISYPTEEFFSLRKPADSVVTHEPDAAYHELEKFLALAAKSNPTVLETLWLDSYEASEPGWGTMLLNIRDAFACQHYVMNAYVGYAESQFRKMMAAGDSTARSRSPKNARHMLRLMEQGKHLYETGELLVRVQNPDQYREWEAWSTDRLSDEFTRQWQDFLGAKSVLPEEPDWGRINDYLRQYRRGHL